MTIERHSSKIFSPQSVPSIPRQEAPGGIYMADFQDCLMHVQENPVSYPPLLAYKDLLAPGQHQILRDAHHPAAQETVDKTFGTLEISDNKSCGLDAKSRIAETGKKPAPTPKRQAHQPEGSLTLEDRTRTAEEILRALIDSDIGRKG